jgi:hypothetical protein
MRPLRREQVWSQTSRGTGLIYRRKDWVQLGTGKEVCAGDMRGHKRVMRGSGWAGAQNAAHCAREISREASHGIAARKRCSHKPRSTLLIKTRTGARGHPWVPDSVFTVYADTPCSPPICLHFPHHMARTFHPLFHWCQWCLFTRCTITRSSSLSLLLLLTGTLLTHPIHIALYVCMTTPAALGLAGTTTLSCSGLTKRHDSQGFSA